MWIIQFLPISVLDIITSVLIVLGILGLLIASLIKFIAFINIYRTPIMLISAALLVVGIYYKGAVEIETKWRTRVAELEIEVKKAEAKSAEINTEIVTKTVTKIQKQIEYRDRVRTEIQVKKEFIDKDCKLTPEAVEAYNKAIAGEKQ